jgi:hypothetical protein
MKVSAWVKAERKRRDDIGRYQYRPNGGEFVVHHPRGLIGEALDETLDCLNYLDRVKSQRAIEAAMLVQEAAELLAMEAGYGD